MGYVDTGVKKGVPKDYMDYAGNPEKSSGVFDSRAFWTTSGRRSSAKS